MNLPHKIEHYVRNMKCEKITEGMSMAKVIKYYDDDKTYYLKIEKSNSEVVREHELYHWLKGKLPVPEIIYDLIDYDLSYLLISKAEGVMLEDDFYRDNTDLLVKLAADGIKMLQSINITNCTFDSSIDCKLKMAKGGIESGITSYVDKNEYTVGLETVQDVYDFLVLNKPIENLVFTHGDYCFNNYFANGNEISCFIDLGRAGVGDIYQDIALCVRELMDFDYKYTNLFFKYLGIPPDYKKIKYYILLDELF